MDKLLLIDGHSILNRAFYGVPLLTNHEGLHTNAVYGFVNILQKALEEEAANYVAVAFDLKAPTFRHKMFEDYKGTRKPMPEELHEQVPVIKELLTAMHIPVITLEGYEADDILGTLAKKAQTDGYEVSILSGDRDLLQLADEHIRIRLPKTAKGITTIESYGPELVKEKYGVTPLEFIDLKALMGDTSDNIPGVPGIGEKTATSIISQYHSIEEAYEHIEEITPAKARNNLSEHFDLAKMSKTLATICITAPIELDYATASFDSLYTKEAYPIYVRLELKTLLKKYTEIPETVAKEDPSEQFIYSDGSLSEAFCKEAYIGKTIGLSVVSEEEEILSVAVCDGEKVQCFVTNIMQSSDSVSESVIWLCRHCHVKVLDLKKLLHTVPVSLEDSVDDISLMNYLINPIKERYEYPDIALEQLALTLPSVKELVAKQSLRELHFREPEILQKIAGLEAYVAYHASRGLEKTLTELSMDSLYQEIERPIVFVLRSMEAYGIRVNREALKAYGENLGERITELESRIYEAAGAPVNINSPKQLGELLFEKLALPGGKKTKTGYSTAADVLEKLAAEYPIVADILEYRTLSKLKSTYADGLDNYIQSDGRIHGTFNQMITATGRLSSTEPNLQNIPIRMELGRQIRKVFIPEDGYTFVDADYSQIELRLLAHMSGDQSLIDAYHEDSDIHRITASKVFHVPLSEVTNTMRSNAKAVNFGIVYGISSFGLSNNLSISKKEAAEYIEQYFETFPRLKSFQEELVSQAKELGCSKTLYGRVRPIPEIKESNFMRRQFGERIAMNSPLQGTAADIIKLAMLRVYRRLKEEQLSSRLILQIHDELLIETAPGESEAVHRILQEEMTNAAHLKVTLEIDIHEGKDWYEAK